jgi:hypothetical protein
MPQGIELGLGSKAIINGKQYYGERIHDNTVKIIEKKCPRCGKKFKTKSGISGYL